MLPLQALLVSSAQTLVHLTEEISPDDPWRRLSEFYQLLFQHDPVCPVTSKHHVRPPHGRIRLNCSYPRVSSIEPSGEGAIIT